MAKGSLAVAYAMKKRNKMAKGGVVAPDAIESEILKDRKIDMSADVHGEDRMMDTSPDKDEPQEAMANLSHGEGMPGQEPDDQIPDESLNSDASLIDAILDERRRKKMAKGGQVVEAGDTADVFEPEDAWSGHGQDGNLKENYASDLSNDDLDQSLVGQILRDRKKKRE